jgi:hypothetical protein
MGKTPGLNLPFGIDTVNAVPVDSNYGPYSSTAEAIASIPLALRYDGLTVQITGTGEYHWLQADLSDTGLIAKTGGGGGGFPIARTVYLVNDASDQTLMGGTGNNVYITFQTAYVAADALQVSLGGSLKVALKVSDTVAATVGDLTLSANYNSNVIIIGNSKSDSLLGNIVASNAAGTGYSVVLSAYDCTIGTINTSATGATGDGGAITLTGDAFYGTITTSLTNATNTGTGGAVTLNGLNGKNSCGNVNTSGGTLGIGGAVTLTNGWNITGTINLSGGSTSGMAGTLSCTDSVVTGTITHTQTNTVAGTSNITLLRATIANLTVTTSGSIGLNNVNITNSTFSTFSFTQNGTSAFPTFTMRKNIGTFTCILGSSFNLGATLTIDELTSTGILTLTNNSTAGGSFAATVRSSAFQRVLSVGASGSGSSEINFINTIFTSTSSTLTSRAISIRAADSGGGITTNIINCTYAYAYIKALNGAINAIISNPLNNQDITIDVGDSSSTGFSSDIKFNGLSTSSVIFNVGGEINTDVYNIFFNGCSNIEVFYTSTLKFETLDLELNNSFVNLFDVEAGALTLDILNSLFGTYSTAGSSSVVINPVNLFADGISGTPEEAEAGTRRIDIENRQTFDSSLALSHDWENRRMWASDGTSYFNYDNFTLNTPNYFFGLFPMTATAASAITPADGNLVYVTTTNGTFTSVGFWGYENGVWVKL